MQQVPVLMASVCHNIQDNKFWIGHFQLSYHGWCHCGLWHWLTCQMNDVLRCSFKFRSIERICVICMKLLKMQFFNSRTIALEVQEQLLKVQLPF